MFSEVVKDRRWVNAMNEEMEALCKIETWDRVSHAPTKKAIDCRQIYKVKYNANGSVNHFKARLVAKGRDYEETFARVAKMTTERTIITLATTKEWQLHQMMSSITSQALK